MVLKTEYGWAKPKHRRLILISLTVMQLWWFQRSTSQFLRTFQFCCHRMGTKKWRRWQSNFSLWWWSN